MPSCHSRTPQQPGSGKRGLSICTHCQCRRLAPSCPVRGMLRTEVWLYPASWWLNVELCPLDSGEWAAVAPVGLAWVDLPGLTSSLLLSQVASCPESSSPQKTGGEAFSFYQDLASRCSVTGTGKTQMSKQLSPASRSFPPGSFPTPPPKEAQYTLSCLCPSLWQAHLPMCPWSQGPLFPRCQLSFVTGQLDFVHVI